MFSADSHKNGVSRKFKLRQKSKPISYIWWTTKRQQLNEKKKQLIITESWISLAIHFFAQNYKNSPLSVSVCAYLILDFGFTSTTFARATQFFPDDEHKKHTNREITSHWSSERTISISHIRFATEWKRERDTEHRSKLTHFAWFIFTPNFTRSHSCMRGSIFSWSFLHNSAIYIYIRVGYGSTAKFHIHFIYKWNFCHLHIHKLPHKSRLLFL